MAKKKYLENPNPKKEYEKKNIRKILNKKENLKKTNMRKILNQKENMKKNKYKKNLGPKKENRKKIHKKNKQCLNNVRMFCQQIRQGHYYIFTVCHRCLYKPSVRISEHENIIFLLQNCIVR